MCLVGRWLRGFSATATRSLLGSDTAAAPAVLAVQERKRRGEVEARLDEVNKECSSVKLQLRRLGVK